MSLLDLNDLGLIDLLQNPRDWRSGWGTAPAPSLPLLYASESPPPLTLNRHQRGMTQADVDQLCRAAQHAWRQAGPRQKLVRFVWRGKRFSSDMTILRVRIHAEDGSPVASYWH